MGTPPPANWVETTGQLRKSGAVTLNAAGQGAVTFDPDSARQRWVVISCVVSTNQAATATVVPVATLALNSTNISSMSQGNQRGSTYSGNQDTWWGIIEVGPCDFLSVLFAPAPGQVATPIVGVICTAVITGTKYNRRA